MKISYRKFIGLLFISLLCALPANGKPKRIEIDSPIFHKLTNDDGLSQGTINAIAQDNLGFIWIGTNDGLNRYDGYEIKSFRNIPGDTSSTRFNQIDAIYCDDEGYIWIGTSQGLILFNTKEGRISPYNFTKNSNNFSITSIESDAENNLWVGTSSSGLFYIDLSSDTAFHYSAGSPGAFHIPDNRISEIFTDSKNNLWAGFGSGDIGLINVKDKTYKTVNCGQLRTYEKTMNVATGFVEDKNNTIWITTYGRSLLKVAEGSFTAQQLNKIINKDEYVSMVMWDLEIINDSIIWLGTDLDGAGVFNTHTQTITYYRQGDTDYDINYKTIKTIFKDRDGNIWLGTNGKGLNILSPYTRNFLTITNKRPELMKLNFGSVRSILLEDENNIWVGGYVGMQKINLAKNSSEAYFKNLSYAICQDNNDENLLWIGNEGTGLYMLDKKKQELMPIPGWLELNKLKGMPLANNGNDIYAIANKDKDHLYVCSNAGFHIFNKRTWDYEFFPITDETKGTGETIRLNGMLVDTEDNVWVTSFQGYIFRFNPTEKTFSNTLQQFEGLSDEISRVNSIFQSQTNQFWVGTSNGLFALDFDKNTYRRYTVLDGLPNDVIYGILEDQDRNLWLSTNLGICRFNPVDKSVLSFTKADGLPSNEFNSAAYSQYGTSRLVFGGVNGIVIFNPANITMHPTPPSPVISDFQIVGDSTVKNVLQPYNNTITLRPDQDIFTLYFSSLQYFITHDNQYAIKINEENDQWIDLKDERKITITSLPPGDHTLRIKVSNNSGEWCESPTIIHVKVLPYFSETIYFKFIIAGITALIIALLYWWRVKEIKKQNEKLEKIVEERTTELKLTNQELEKANQTKNKFFSIIAHDLKNPFNSMLGFSDILVKDWKILSEEEKVEFVQIIRDTTEDTFQLLINLLEWSRIQKEEIQFNPTNIKLYSLATDVLNQLKSDSFFKNIRIVNEIGKEIEIYADQNMIHTVMRNLISNAIKFTPKNGKISISATSDQTKTTCCVKDTGVGMDKEVAEKLFNLQYKNTTKGTEGETGTGLGLVLSQEFIKRHNGNFSVESEPGKGSTFCFTIPKNFS